MVGGNSGLSCGILSACSLHVGGKLEGFCLWGGDCARSPSAGSAAGNWKLLAREWREGGGGAGTAGGLTVAWGGSAPLLLLLFFLTRFIFRFKTRANRRCQPQAGSSGWGMLAGRGGREAVLPGARQFLSPCPLPLKQTAEGSAKEDCWLLTPLLFA